MDETKKYFEQFYHELISLPDFNGNYFDAMLNALAMARAYLFIKDSLHK